MRICSSVIGIGICMERYSLDVGTLLFAMALEKRSWFYKGY